MPAPTFLTKRRDRLVSEVPVLAFDVEEWAEYPGLGNLSRESAHAFASWVEDVVRDGDYSPDETVAQLLKRCLEKWIGGRSL
jgi:hypothetical protein